ncbi:hypothetical protein FGO68_gene2111 [Halteria grandinella]|uniref:Uncharacterized protein n=1 Tax=Halteria grandinella TaxID=5974 RepID=A0A8J8T9Y5_HALGN|nr:hypothetical protein FGO68_gene2111 [Halteria grandinella]
MQMLFSSTSSSQQPDARPKYPRQSSLDTLHSKSIKRLDRSTKSHLDQISHYHGQLHSFITKLDTQIHSVANQSHVKMYQDYQNWLKSKEGELKEIKERVQEKIEMKDEQEAIIHRLRQELQHEQHQRFQLDKQREALKKELVSEQRVVERLKGDVVGYRKMAKEEQKKRLLAEIDVKMLKERIEMLEMEVSAYQGKNLQIVINETAASIQKNAVEEISRYCDQDTLRLGNDGNKARFTNFLIQLFDAETSQERIKSELIQYFVAVDLAYRSKINQLLKKSDNLPHCSSTLAIQTPKLSTSKRLHLKNSLSPSKFKLSLEPPTPVLNESSAKKKLHYRPLMSTLSESIDPSHIISKAKSTHEQPQRSNSTLIGKALKLNTFKLTANEDTVFNINKLALSARKLPTLQIQDRFKQNAFSNYDFLQIVKTSRNERLPQLSITQSHTPLKPSNNSRSVLERVYIDFLKTRKPSIDASKTERKPSISKPQLNADLQLI